MKKQDNKDFSEQERLMLHYLEQVYNMQADRETCQQNMKPETAEA